MTFLRLLIGALTIGAFEYLYTHHPKALHMIALLIIALGLLSTLILWLWK